MQALDVENCLAWQRVIPPVWWPQAGRHIVGDRHLPDGTRQHLVEGSAQAGLDLANVQVFGADDHPQVRFSDELSHLSR